MLDLKSEIKNAHVWLRVPKFWGHSLNENNHREVAKAEASYMPAPEMVRLCKPAQHRKMSFTGQSVEVTMKLA